jgi:hypothetical protein
MKRRSTRTRSHAIAPYTKYAKQPYKYPGWCVVGARLPDEIRVGLLAAHGIVGREPTPDELDRLPAMLWMRPLSIL